MSSNRTLLGIVAGVIALVALTVAVVLLGGEGEPQRFPPDSREAAMQGYLAAWDERDATTAYGYLSERIRAKTSLEEYRRAADEFAAYGMPPNGPDRRVVIDGVTAVGSHTVVHLTVEEFYTDGLTQSVSSWKLDVTMVRDPDGWKIDDPLVWLDPMPTYDHPK